MITHDEYIERRDEIIREVYTVIPTPYSEAVFKQAQQAIDALVLAVIGDDEDLNAPLNRSVDDNPESDKYPELYIIRRATRNCKRLEQRSIIKGEL